MDGKKLKQWVLDFLDEEEESSLYADARRIYEALDEAAGLFCRDIPLLHAEETITTVADTQAYDLPPGFLNLHVRNARGRFVIKFYDGETYSFPVLDTYERIYKANYTDNKSWPSRFAIRDKPTKEDLIQGAADSDGASSGGQCTLHDGSMLFTTTNRAHARDIIHNTTDGSTGYVLSVTDATHLVTALFGGTNNDWTAGDSYVLQPAAEKQIYLDAPSDTAGYYLYVPYSCMPDPVFSDYGFWRLPPQVCRGIAYGAAAMIKAPKRQFTEAGQLGGLFGVEFKRARSEIGRQALHSRDWA